MALDPHISQAEQQELTILWMKSQPVVAAYIRSVIRDKHRAEDLLQSVALAAVEHFTSRDPNGTFLAWVMGIARNKVREFCRNDSTRRRVFNDAVQDLIARTHEELAPQYDARHDALEQCMERMQGQGRRLLEMRYLRELKPADVAEQMGMSTNAVFITLHRARLALRKCIESRIARGGI